MKTISALLALLSFVPSAAREIHVDQRHPGASDTQPGTREAPLKTISAAARQVRPGDVVTVAPGLYREAVALTVSGEPGRPIVFQSELPRQAVISGADPLVEPRDEGRGVYSYAVAVRGRVTYLGGNPEWVYLDGLPLERVDTPDRLVPGSFCLDLDAKRVRVVLPERAELAKVSLEYASREGLLAADKPLDDIHVRGFTLQHTANWFRGRGPLVVSGRRWLVEGNHVRWTSYGGLQTKNTNGCVVRDNLIEWAGCDGVGGGYNVDLLFTGNTVRYNNWRSFDWGMEGGGSKWTCTLDCRYVGNEFAYNHGPGIWSDAAATGTIYERNILHDNAVRALFSEINWNEVLQDNIVYNTGEAGILISNGPGMTIRRNVVFNNGSGIGLSGTYTRANDHEQKWYPHAVARMGQVPGITSQQLTRWEAGFLNYYVAPKACLNNNCVVWDNLIFDNVLGLMEQRDYRKPSAMDAFVNNFSDYNLYWAPSERTLFTQGYTNPYDGLAAWRQASGRDEHSQLADPRAPSTKLPAWAAACRRDWDLRMRPVNQAAGTRDDGQPQHFPPSPMAQIAIGRLLRSPWVKAVQLGDARVRGALCEHAGQRMLVLWAAAAGERRLVRLRLGQPRVVVENGYLAQRTQDLPDGCVELVVTANPVYLHGLGATLEESPAAPPPPPGR